MAAKFISCFANSECVLRRSCNCETSDRPFGTLLAKPVYLFMPPLVRTTSANHFADRFTNLSGFLGNSSVNGRERDEFDIKISGSYVMQSGTVQMSTSKAHQYLPAACALWTILFASNTMLSSIIS